MLRSTLIRSLIKGPVAILGGGVSGQGAAKLLSQYGAPHTLFDKDPAIGNPDFGPAEAKRFPWVVYSPGGFRQDHPWLVCAREAGSLCLAELDLAALFWQGHLIAVTGTTGKTTLTEFLAFALREAGVDAVAIGNNGTPFSSTYSPRVTYERWAVCEVSSFQAEGLQFFQPEVIFWTNFSPNHLDAHGTLKNYFKAKASLMALLAPKGKAFGGESVLQASHTLGTPIFPPFAGVVLEAEREIFSFPNSCFNSYPQRENYLLAYKWWQDSGRSLSTLEDAALRFKLPHHRLASIATVDGIQFWNDSKATTSLAVGAALHSFNEPIVWIGGGRSKGEPLESFIKIFDPNKITKAYVLGEMAHPLSDCLAKKNIKTEVCESLEAAVHAAYEERLSKHVLFSPGFTSFDMFRNYAHRGEVFETIVLDLNNPVTVV